MSLGKKKMLSQGGAAAPVGTDNFNTVLYTGNGGTQSITGVGFQPDFVWGKTRNAAQGGFFVDSVRGRNSSLLPYSNSANNPNSSASNDLVSFDSDGFTVGPVEQTFLNSAHNQVAWCWKAGGAPTATNSAGAGNVPTSGSVMIDGVSSSAAVAGNVEAKKMSVNTNAQFSIVKFTSQAGATNQVPHGLNGVPDLFIFKRTDSTESWWAYTTVIDGSLDYFSLNTDATKSDASETAPTATTVYQPTSSSGRDYILYSFKSVDGYQKIGSYTGSSSEHSVNIGFAPRFIMIKRTDASEGWRMYDSARDGSSVPRRVNHNLQANETSVEYDASGDANGYFNITSTGLLFYTGNSSNGVNANGGTYIYLAIA
jgi:hypothetical protein